MFDRINQGRYWARLLRLVDGCTPCSPGCRCWVAREAKVRTYGAKDLLGPDGMWNGNIRLRPDNLDLPLRTRKPQAWLILNDLFHEDVPYEFIQDAFCKMAEAPQHIFLVLTKRAKRLDWFVREQTSDCGGYLNQGNVWLGVTVCTPDELWKIDELRKIPAAVHWVSFEPLLADLGELNLDHIEGVVLGGETGPGARPMPPNGPRRVRDDCVAAGVPFFFKQWGKLRFDEPTDISDWVSADYDPYSKNGGRYLDGREWNELPEVKI